MTADGLRVRRAPPAERSQLLAWAERFDPESCVVADRLSTDADFRRCRVWVAEDHAKTVVGLVLFDHICFDRWLAYPLLDDGAAGVALAPVVDASPAWGVEGIVRHAGPFVGRLTRSSAAPVGRTFAVLGYEVLEQPEYGEELDTRIGPVDDRTRLAGQADLPALVDLYDAYELQRVPTRPRLRRYLSRIIARLPVVVAEHEGHLVGAMRAEAMSARTILWDESTVLPDYRGQGLYLAMIRRSFATAAELGRGCAGTLQPSTPLRIPDEVREWTDYDPGGLTLLFLRLRAPVHFRGHQRLRRLLETVEGQRPRRRL